MLERDVEVLEHLWITMSDGRRLAAKIWLPADAALRPVPAVLEYIPYRKRDFKAVRDAQIHGYFAQHGFAGVRVDLRGSGDSEGVLRGEYLQSELDDGLEVLRWIAAQPWCSGKVGLFGLSWGGFNGLQLAALRPPELGAVITVCSSDDRYADDVHYMGGCLLTDNLSWASTMFAYNSCPPDPLVVGERWREMWLERLEGSGLWLLDWLKHQRRDEFWRHGSICEDYSAVQVPVFAVSGWADGYSNTVFHLLQNLNVPRRGLIGAWGHKYPHMGGPGPEIGFLQECVRWWEQWLNPAGTPAAPPVAEESECELIAWMRDSFTPTEAERPGRWVRETGLSSGGIRLHLLEMTALGLSDTAQTEDAEQAVGETYFQVQSPLSVGLFAGKWCSYAESTDLPNDQREEDGGALVFDGLPLEEAVEILGAPVVELELSADRPQAQVAVRLSGVAPNGVVSRVSYGVLNLSHRNSHEEPEALEPGRRYRVRVKLNHIAQRFPVGHRIRVAVSSSYWPLIWPAPELARLTVYSGGRLELPVRTARMPDPQPVFDAPESAPAPATTLIAPAHREWTVVQNLATNHVSLNVINNDARYTIDDIDLSIGKNVSERYSYTNNRYDTVRGEVFSTREFARGDWVLRTETRTVLTSTTTHFRVRATLDAYEGDARVFAKSWDEIIARDFV